MMNQEERTAQLRQAKEQVLAQVKEKVAKRHIHGTVMELEIDGQPHRMLHYGTENPNPPVYFDIHGGGFVWGMMEEGDLLCHHINESLGFEVYALDYPLGPDVRFPTALEYLYRTIDYMRLQPERFHLNPAAMVVGGRSAGGNLAAALCLLAKERGEFQFACQVLDHPYLDLCHLLSDDLRYQGEGALPSQMMDELAAAYAEQAQRYSILCSPLNAATEQLRGLPPAVVQTCELDSLRPDGDAYAEKLRSAGVRTIHHCYPGVAHGFTELEGPEERAGQEWLMQGIRELLPLQP